MKGCLYLQDNTKFRSRALILSDKYSLSLKISLRIILTYGIQPTPIDAAEWLRQVTNDISQIK
jgi:hypothetical protein